MSSEVCRVSQIAVGHVFPHCNSVQVCEFVFLIMKRGWRARRKSRRTLREKSRQQAVRLVALGIALNPTLLGRRGEEGIHAPLFVVKLRTSDATASLLETVEMDGHVRPNQDQLQSWWTGGRLPSTRRGRRGQVPNRQLNVSSVAPRSQVFGPGCRRHPC